MNKSLSCTVVLNKFYNDLKWPGNGKPLKVRNGVQKELFDKVEAIKWNFFANKLFYIVCLSNQFRIE